MIDVYKALARNWLKKTGDKMISGFLVLFQDPVSPMDAATKQYVDAAISGGTTPSGPAGGDLTGTYPNPTLIAIIAAGGPTGSGSVVPVITWDAKGRLTSVTSAAITGAPPTGFAGGDLAGSFPNPTLAVIGASATKGTATRSATVTIDTKGRVTALSDSVITLAGDVTGDVTAAVLASVIVAGGPVGSGSVVPVITWDAKGRLLAVTSAPITGAPPTGAAGGDLTGTYPNPTLASIIAAGGPLGSGSVVPVITWDAKGRLIAVTSAPITGAPPTGAAGGDLTGTFPNPTLANVIAAGGPVGSPTTTPVVTWDAKGRLLVVGTATIAGPFPPNGAAGGDLQGTFPNPTVIPRIYPRLLLMGA